MSKYLTLQKISARHKEIARRLVLGQSAVDIAKALGIHQGTISHLKQSALFKVQMKQLEAMRDAETMDINKQISDAAEGAVNEVERLMYRSEDEKIRLAAAKDLLDRAGYNPTNKTEVQHSGTVAHAHLTDEEVRRMILGRLGRGEEIANTRQSALEEAENTEFVIDAEEDEPPQETPISYGQ